FEGKVVGGAAEGGKQQHPEGHCDQVDRGAGADRKHHPGGKVEVIGFRAQRACPVRMAATRPNSASRAAMLSGVSQITCSLPECSLPASPWLGGWGAVGR